MKYGLPVVVAAVLALAACINTAGIKWDYTTPTTPTYNEGPVGGGR
jgi:hypothetical protein